MRLVLCVLHYIKFSNKFPFSSFLWWSKTTFYFSSPVWGEHGSFSWLSPLYCFIVLYLPCICQEAYCQYLSSIIYICHLLKDDAWQKGELMLLVSPEYSCVMFAPWESWILRKQRRSTLDLPFCLNISFKFVWQSS